MVDPLAPGSFGVEERSVRHIVLDKMTEGGIAPVRIAAVLKMFVASLGLRKPQIEHRYSVLARSQIGQDFWVFGEAFDEQEGGFFLDVGAADGVSVSNTLVLERVYQWRGICVEANPVLFQKLERARTATCVNACVDSKPGSVSFQMKGLDGGIIRDERAGQDPDQGPIITLETKPLESVLKEANAPSVIDYFSIDVEGAETVILCSFPFDSYRFNCLTVERPGLPARKALARNGYRLVKDVPDFDAFYIHESFVARYRANTKNFWKKVRGVA